MMRRTPIKDDTNDILRCIRRDLNHGTLSMLIIVHSYVQAIDKEVVPLEGLLLYFRMDFMMAGALVYWAHQYTEDDISCAV